MTQRFWLRNRSGATARCKCCGAQLQKVSRTCLFLTVLTSEVLSRHSVVQILGASTSKSRPSLSVFNDVEFRTALAPQRGANVGDILGSWSSAPARFGSWLSEPAEPQNYGKTQHFAQFLPAKTSSSHTSQLYHICAITSLCWQIFSGNSQYRRKLDS